MSRRGALYLTALVGATQFQIRDMQRGKKERAKKEIWIQTCMCMS